MVYAIRDWSRNFENADSRKAPIKHLDWLKLPVKLSGRGYLKLATGKDGARHFGVWCALLQLAAMCRPRGSLVHGDGEPMTIHDIHLILRFPMVEIETALTRLEEIGWVELVPPSPGDPRPLPATPDDSTLRVDKTEKRGEREEKVPSEPCPAEAGPVDAVLAHYRSYHPRSRPGAKERKLVASRLAEGYSPADLQAAIDGNHRDPHCCGQNERGTEYHDLTLIFRDSSHVQRYMAVAQNGHAVPAARPANLAALAAWKEINRGQAG